jgi:putative oxidoreductase
MATSSEDRRDTALLILRVMLGLTLVFSHGLPKVMEPDRWEATGRAMQSLGVGFAPTFFGFMAGASELVAGLLFLVGLAVRPAAAVMIFVMFVAASQSLVTAGTLGGGRAHPIDAAAGYLVVLLLGAGSYSLDRKFGFDRARAEAPRQPATAGA